MKNITVAVPDDVYRNARVTATQRGTSVSALVVAYLEQLSGQVAEFDRLEALQREVQTGISEFRAASRQARDKAHDRAVRGTSLRTGLTRLIPPRDAGGGQSNQ